jgi:hypothetical protein
MLDDQIYSCVVILQTSAMPSIHLFLGFPRVLYPVDLLYQALDAILFVTGMKTSFFIFSYGQSNISWRKFPRLNGSCLERDKNPNI